MGSDFKRHLVALAVVWAIAAVGLFQVYDRGWIPHDEGTYAQSAERVLQGELPHRDFDGLYTGGLEYLYAGAFRLLGTDLKSLRIMLLLASLGIVPVVYAIAAQAAPPAAAAAVTLTALVWSLPHYFAPMSNWYLVFPALLGTWALLRHGETKRARWLVAAGIFGGLGVLVKSLGVYFVTAGALYLFHREQEDAAAEEGAPRSRGVLVVLCVVTATFDAALLRLVWPRLAPMEFVHFVLPGWILTGYLVWFEARHGRGTLPHRAKRLARTLGPFAIAAALPVLFFLVPYAASGAFGDFLRGVFVLPQRRFYGAAFPLPPLWSLVTALPFAALLAFPRAAARVPARFGVPAAVLCLLPLLLAGPQRVVYWAVWTSVRPVVPVAVALGCFFLARARRTDTGPVGRCELFLLLCVAGLVSLLQFPYSMGAYFCFISPLAVLAALYTARHQTRTGALHACLLLFYIAFGLFWVDTASTAGSGVFYLPRPPAVPLTLERASLRVLPEDAQEYTNVVREVQAHSLPGAEIFAGPDCPEICFLAARRNPTRTIFEIFDADAKNPQARTNRLLATLEERHIDVAVVNTDPDFSGTLDPEFAAQLRLRYPNVKFFRKFAVRWRS